MFPKKEKEKERTDDRCHKGELDLSGGRGPAGGEGEVA